MTETKKKVKNGRKGENMPRICQQTKKYCICAVSKQNRHESIKYFPREGYPVVIRGMIYQDAIPVLNRVVYGNTASKYKKQGKRNDMKEWKDP